MSLLEVRGLDAGYGDFQALFGVDLAVEEGETVSMIGANGAGKSTLLRVIAGLIAPMRGEIRAGIPMTFVAFGIAVVMVTTWYWGGPFGRAKPMLCGLLVACALVVVGNVLVTLARASGREATREALRDRRLRQSAGMALLCFAGIAAIMTVTETQLFVRDNLTVITGGNNDAPSYALLGQHVLDDGPDEPGNIAGFTAI